jgi:hypothetical protein
MGVNMHMWQQQPVKDELQLTPILQTLDKVREHVLVLQGLDNKEALSADAGPHPRAQAAWLTGCRAKKTSGPDIHLGVSLDQIIAKEFAKETQLGSLELTTDLTDLAGECAQEFSCAYNNTIAWRTPTTPLPMESNPTNVFERLFGASGTTDQATRLRQLKSDASILDVVKTRLAGLQRGLGPVDRRKLAEYTDAIRDVERRIQKAGEQASKELPLVEQPGGIPASFEDYIHLMMDLQVLAFQTDMTRVVTFVLIRESNNRSYPEIGVPDSHHPLSHHQHDPEKLARLAKVNAFHVAQLAYLTEKLKATQDGNGSLLDHTLLLYGSGMSDPNMHIPYNVPTLLVAGKEYGIKGNRCLTFPEKTPLANLQVTIAEKMGLSVERFGDSNGDLPGLDGV